MPIFISHDFEDKAAYSSLCLALDGANVPHWDVATMSSGLPLAQQLKNAISDCEACIFIASQRSIESRWCMAELGAFWGGGKPVVIYVVDPNVKDTDHPPQFKGNLWTNDANEVIKAVKGYLTADMMEALPISGGMVYILLQLNKRGWSLKDIVSMWKSFNDTQAETDQGYKAAKYACQCLEALGFAQRFGGDEYGITDKGKRFIKTELSKTKYARAFRDLDSADGA